VFITGAGISVASGIPTFRGSDPDAVWANDVMEMGTFAYFEEHPVEQWLWYLKRFDGCHNAKPNNAHTAITDIERWLHSHGRRCLTITQNIDGLHVDAGTKCLIQIHGSAKKVRCSQRYCDYGEPKGSIPWDDTVFEAFRAAPSYDTLPKCPGCLQPLRAHVLWFDEYYTQHEDYEYTRATEAAFEATCVVFVGTSFSVGITDTAVQVVRQMGLPAFVIDPYANRVPFEGAILVRELSEVYLPQVASALP
jgi:NAD-dependent SIR2 family protein deacetylase